MTDDPYAAAVAIVRKFGKASPSLVQRELKIQRYAVAERLIKRMVAEGLVDGPFFDAPTYRLVKEFAP